MNSNSVIGYEKGMIVNLTRIMNEGESHMKYSEDLLDVISVVLEKKSNPGTLKNNDYNAFTLRKKIFYHQCTYTITVYAPLMAVNMTKH